MGVSMSSKSNLINLSQFITSGKSVTICPPKNKPKHRKSTHKIFVREQLIHLLKNPINHAA